MGKVYCLNVSVIPFCDANTGYSIDVVLDKTFNVFRLFLKTKKVTRFDQNFHLNLKLLPTWK